jgi:hypothetical protein
MFTCRKWRGLVIEHIFKITPYVCEAATGFANFSAERTLLDYKTDQFAKIHAFLKYSPAVHVLVVGLMALPSIHPHRPLMHACIG